MALSKFVRVLAACAAVVASAAEKEQGSFPFPDAITRLLCKELEDVSVEAAAVEEACSKVTAIPTPVCEELLRTAWHDLEEKCPKTSGAGASIGIPPAIKDFICKELEDATVEDAVVDKVCSKVEAIPRPKSSPDWHRQTARSSQTGARGRCHGCPGHCCQPPSESMRKLPRSAEGSDPGEVCSRVSEKLKFVPEAACEATLRHGWEELANMCPKKATMLPTPIERIIEHDLCKELKSGTEERQIPTVVCDKVTDVYKFLPGLMCRSYVLNSKKDIEAKCPKEKALSLPEPVERAIRALEEVVCRQLEKADDLPKVASEACALVHDHFGEFPEEACEDVAKMILEKAARVCKSATPSVLV
eukprot:CAMPEP_0117523558 /NCGR_PEP_ID=MMETSP0784-20121206/34789_1 /TAXON_ID=39447 /ORGANISM="" /LENGTH=359 /DNA_ID=CAMNT_0005319673 /DNA_START=62 /DNA_END=1141 /DNA_ORIENTATION=-